MTRQPRKASGMDRVPRYCTVFRHKFVRNLFALLRDDLAARNIQRGRDHGLPSYFAFRRFCRLDAECNWDKAPVRTPTPPSSSYVYCNKSTGFFLTLQSHMRPDIWRRLRALYDNPYDVDLFTGGFVETGFNGGLLGPTFNCIVGW